jgi:hypothetical protein
MVAMATDVVPTKLLDVHDLPLEALAALDTTEEILARILPSVPVRVPEPKFNSTI